MDQTPESASGEIGLCFAKGVVAVTNSFVAMDVDLPANSVTQVQADGRAICLVRMEDGSLHAVDDACSHEGACLSEGELFEGSIECPLHGSLFDVRTGAV